MVVDRRRPAKLGEVPSRPPSRFSSSFHFSPLLGPTLLRQRHHYSSLSMPVQDISFGHQGRMIPFFFHVHQSIGRGGISTIMLIYCLRPNVFKSLRDFTFFLVNKEVSNLSFISFYLIELKRNHDSVKRLLLHVISFYLRWHCVARATRESIASTIQSRF